MNAKGTGVCVKYHGKPADGIETIDRHESTRLAGKDPAVATRDLFEWIASGKTVEYDLNVQLMPFEDEFELGLRHRSRLKRVTGIPAAAPAWAGHP